LIDAAREAGKIALGYWRKNPRYWEKDGGAGPVSEADLAVNAILAEKLRAARPDYGWLSEESEDDPARLSAARVFILDPIDGTRAFLAGEKGFSHALAVVEAGRVIAGVVYLPAAEKLYEAEAGEGARLNGAAIRPSGHETADGARILASSHALRTEHWPKGVPKAERHFRPSLAYRICRVADGSFDATLTFRPCWEWDIAAASLIAEEAGASVTGGEGEALAFNAPIPRAQGLIAAPPALHVALLTARRG
jgi:myo-inositol-1(or 4)-monophosphatase